MAPDVSLGKLSELLSHTRFLFTLRSRSNPAQYHSLLLFRLSSQPTAVLGHDILSHSDYQLYAMESTCPHLGAELSHAEIEDCGDDLVAVCPWHRYDFSLRTGKSETGLRACTYAVEVRTDTSSDEPPEVWVEAPGDGDWELVELRPVSEEFADPPPASPTPDPAQSVTENLASLKTTDQMESKPKTLLDWAVLVLNTSNPEQKVARTRQAVSEYRTGKITSIGRAKSPLPPETPPREDLRIVEPSKVTKRGKAGTVKSRIAILHALANIEQWAVDLAWDVIARFGPHSIDGTPLPPQFFSDWAKVAEDEAKHFTLLRTRLLELGSFYGEHTVHAGLWQSALQTKGSLSSRLCIIHLVHEARGLDVNPTTIAKFRAAGDLESVRVLEIIHHDEITHVTAGHRWFTWLCNLKNVDPVQTFRHEVKTHFVGALKGPFNVEDRRKAGMDPEFYEDLRGDLGIVSAPEEKDDRGKVVIEYEKT